MAIGEIAALISSVKTAVDIAKGVSSFNVEYDRKQSISKLLETLLSVQSEALTVQAKAQSLEFEKHELSKKLMELDNWSETESQYALEELSSGVFVYVYKNTDDSGKPIHWLCANCYGEQKKSILQQTATFVRGTQYTCYACGSEIIDTRTKSEPRTQRRVIHRGVDSWMEK